MRFEFRVFPTYQTLFIEKQISIFAFKNLTIIELYVDFLDFQAL